MTTTRRTLYWLISLVVLVAGVSRSSPTAVGQSPIELFREQPTRPIQPGAPVCTIQGPLDDGMCGQWSTLNFVFKDAHGKLYIGASAHNFGAVGDPARVRGERRPFGTVVVDDDTADFLHPGDRPGFLGATDFALIRINPNRYRDVDPAVRGFAGPTGYATAEETATGDVVNAYGQGRPDLKNPIGPRSGTLVYHSDRAFVARTEAAGGDSGMPYIHEATGKALGVLAYCLCADVGTYPTIGYVIERMAGAGFNLQLVVAPHGVL